MRVLVAGATGALGRPLVAWLVAQGHTVVGLARHPGRMAALEALGAEAALADALDASALTRAVVDAAPDAVVHALTALPASGPRRARDLVATNRLRRDGTANLVRAAREAGATRLVGASLALGYGHRPDAVVDESAPFAHPRARTAAASMTAGLAALEGHLRAAGDLHPVVLRFGLFYGPGTHTDHLPTALRRRMLPLPPGDGLLPWVHVDDAAAATVAALETAPAEQVTYNVADDQAAGMRAVAACLASHAGVPGPGTAPAWLLALAAPVAVAVARTRLQVSSAAARRELGWAPAFPTYREGLAASSSRSA